MPWSVKKSGKGYAIIKPGEHNKVVGHSTSKEKAEASVRARYAAMNARGEFFGKRKTGTK
jgi:hypothetical protein